jgi:DNA-binding NarL/FixJ family response regulator
MIVHATPTHSAVLLDDQPLWLEALEHLMAPIGIEAVGKTTSVHEALALVEQLRPSSFLMGMEAAHGVLDWRACIREATERVPDLKTVVLSMSNERQLIEEAYAAGALAFVLKTARPEDIASAIRQVFDHSIYLFDFPDAAPGKGAAARSGGQKLTNREAEILSLVAQGLPNAQVAQLLWLSEPTVKVHLSRIYRKIEVSNRTEASRWAQRHGLLRENIEVSREVRAT